MLAAVRGRWSLMLRTGGVCALVQVLLAEREDDPRDCMRCLGIDEDPESVLTPGQRQFRHAAALVVADQYAGSAHVEDALVEAVQPSRLFA
jgi:hypothetical protein